MIRKAARNGFYICLNILRGLIISIPTIISGKIQMHLLNYGHLKWSCKKWNIFIWTQSGRVLLQIRNHIYTAVPALKVLCRYYSYGKKMDKLTHYGPEAGHSATRGTRAEAGVLSPKSVQIFQNFRIHSSSLSKNYICLVFAMNFRWMILAFWQTIDMDINTWYLN